VISPGNPAGEEMSEGENIACGSEYRVVNSRKCLKEKTRIKNAPGGLKRGECDSDNGYAP